MFELEHWPEAARAYRQALGSVTNPDWTYFNLGRVSAKLADWASAAECYREAQKLNPDLPQIELRLARALLRQTAECEFVEEAQEIIDELYRARHLQNGDGESSPVVGLEAAKSTLDAISHLALENLLLSESRLVFPSIQQPQVSVLLVLYNRCELTLTCLQSLLASPFKSFEVVIIDNDSSDRTSELLDRIDGATIIRNDENRHFLAGCNQAARQAKGQHLLFLNNDTKLLGDSLGAAHRLLTSSPSIGAVGGRLILPDGTLQEAGNIIWQDGSCLGYGRGEAPDDPKFMFRREVDYCSGAFLMTGREQFFELGGFDEDFAPAYYEETDYCVRLQKAGKKVVYDPDIALMHYEFASSGSSERAGSAIDLQRRNQRIFAQKNKDWLAFKYEPEPANILRARSVADGKRRLLFIDDRVPHPHLGSGFTRGHYILNAILEQNWAVTVFPTDLGRAEDWAASYSDIPREVEILHGYGLERLVEFLKSRPNYFDALFISRPHNMAPVQNLLAEDSNGLENTRIIYDAESIFCMRDLEQRMLEGEEISATQIQAAVADELALADGSDLVMTVSPRDQARFLDAGHENAEVLGHAIACQPTPKSFDERSGILFVGSIHELASPNADSVLWFAEHILPKLRAEAAEDIQLIVAGTNTSDAFSAQLDALGDPSISRLGRVDDLTELYDRCRLFIAPTRFASGIPYKVHEAASYGIPVVCTQLLATQLGWQDGQEVLVAEEADAFAAQCARLYQDRHLWKQLRHNALQAVEEECSRARFNDTLKAALGPRPRADAPS